MFDVFPVVVVVAILAYMGSVYNIYSGWLRRLNVTDAHLWFVVAVSNIEINAPFLSVDFETLEMGPQFKLN